ncbi:hypothetical protein NBRC116597_01720 [Phaeobacter sp. NW0010-22]
MGFMGMVHCDHIRDHRRRPGKPGEIRHHIQPALRLQQKRGMRDVTQPNGIIGYRILPTRKGHITQARRCLSQRNAMARPPILRANTGR